MPDPVVNLDELAQAAAMSVKLALDARVGPKQPWYVENGNVFSADHNRIAEVVTAKDGRMICGLISGATAISSSLYNLTKLLAAAGRDGWDSEPGKVLAEVILKLMALEADGRLPRIQ